MDNYADDKEYLATVVPAYPDFPKPGIIFRDALAILKNPTASERLFKILLHRIDTSRVQPTAIVALDSRGFLFGSVLAYKLRIPLVTVRKKGKLPGPVIQQAYQLEYGEDVLEIQRNLLTKNDRVLLVDDLMATGGTLKAAYELVRCCEAAVIEAMVVIELEALEARQRLPFNVFSVLQF